MQRAWAVFFIVFTFSVLSSSANAIEDKSTISPEPDTQFEKLIDSLSLNCKYSRKNELSDANFQKFSLEVCKNRSLKKTHSKFVKTVRALKVVLDETSRSALLNYLSVLISYRQTLCKSGPVTCLQSFYAQRNILLQIYLQNHITTFNSAPLGTLESWLVEASEGDKCDSTIEQCEQKLGLQKIRHYLQYYQNTYPVKLAKTDWEGIDQRQLCKLEQTLSADIQVYASAGYPKDKPHYYSPRYGAFEVVVNSPDKPVVLILADRQPRLWNVSWTEGTDIKAVLLVGKGRQAVAGLPYEIPVMVNTDTVGSPCGLVWKKRLKPSFNNLSQIAFKKDVASQHSALRTPNILMGKKIDGEPALITVNEVSPDFFYVSSNDFLYGKQALHYLEKKGLIRKATQNDVQRWRSQSRLKSIFWNTARTLMRVLFYLTDFRKRYEARQRDTYVILAPLKLPEAMFGVDFFLEKGVPMPEGYTDYIGDGGLFGYRFLYDFNTMQCHGPDCRWYWL